MRKLLVASQKGGVGKTTTSLNLAAAAARAGSRVLLLEADPLSSISTSLNLAQHERRQPLRGAGIDLPGVLVPSVLPGLDVLSPYEDGGCPDDELDRLLRLLRTPALEEFYGCLLVDAPPFLGANPGQLLNTCDEFMLVMRAEPMAYRTLPAFLELVQRSRKGPKPIQPRGILLTLPDGEAPGGRWERELRGRFGTRIMPQVIPFDDEVSKALLFGQVVVQSSPDSPAALPYRHIAEVLSLADVRGAGHSASAESVLKLAASQVQARSRPVPVLAAAAVAAASVPVPVSVAAATEELDEPYLPTERSVGLPEMPTLPTDADLPSLSRLVPLPALSPSAPRPGKHRSPAAQPAPTTPAPEKRSKREVTPAKQPTAKAGGAKTPPATPLSVPPWLLGVGVAAVIGVGLRFIKLPAYVLPVAVGLAVAGGVVLLLRIIQTLPDGSASTKETAKPETAAPGSKPEIHKPAVRKEASARLSALARPKPTPRKK